MRVRPIALIAVALVLAAAAPGRAEAGDATEALRPAIDQVLRILGDEALRGPSQTPARRRVLRAVMDGVIDFPDAARRALGPHWQARSQAEREEFVAVFKDLVSSSYIVTMEAYAGQSVLFVGETQDEGIASVLTRVQGGQRPSSSVEYRMHRRDGRWLVYDVVVEGVSLVGNYRAQFNTVIRTSSYAELLQRMRARVAELTPGRTAGLDVPMGHGPWHAELRALLSEVVAPTRR